MNLLQSYLPYWPVFAAALVFAVYAVVLFALSRRALRNQKGGLEWVREYGKPGFDFSLRSLSFQKPDWLCGFGVAVCSLLVGAVYLMVKSYAQHGVPMQGIFSLHGLLVLGLGIVGALSVWLLSGHLTKSNLLSVCCAVLFTVVCINKHNTMCVLAVSLLFLQRWFAADEEKPLFPRELLYYLACGLLVVCSVSAAPILWLLPAYMLLHILRSLNRFSGRGGKLALCFVLAAVMWLLCSVLLVFGTAYLLYGNNLFRHFLSIVTNSNFWRIMREIFVRLPRCMVARPARSYLLSLLIDAPLVMLGGAAALSALLAVLRRHDAQALLALCVMVAFGAVWLLSGSYLLSLPLVLLIGCFGTVFLGSGKKAPLVLYTIAASVYYIALYVCGRLVPLYAEIVVRLT